MSLFRRDGRRLPGKLADETPGLEPAESARLGELYTQRQQAEQRSAASERAKAKLPAAEAGRWEPRQGSGGIPTPIHDALQREYNALLLELAATEAERDTANARIRGLETALAAYAGHTRATPRMAMHIERDDLLIKPLAGHDPAGH